MIRGNNWLKILMVVLWFCLAFPAVVIRLRFELCLSLVFFLLLLDCHPLPLGPVKRRCGKLADDDHSPAFLGLDKFVPVANATIGKRDEVPTTPPGKVALLEEFGPIGRFPLLWSPSRLPVDISLLAYQ